MENENKFVNLKQAAERLEVSHERVRQFIAQGRLAAFRVGWQWLITRAELERFAALERPTGRPPAEEGEGE